MPANQITYTITGQAQNRINQLMVKHSPKHSLMIWVASLSCLVIPMLVFGRSLSTITLSGLFGSSLITLFILKLALKYAVHKRYGLYYQPDLELETRTLTLNEDSFCISSDLTKATSRPYKQIKSIKVEDNVVIIRGKTHWYELIPRDCVTAGNIGFLTEELAERANVKLK